MALYGISIILNYIRKYFIFKLIDNWGSTTKKTTYKVVGLKLTAK